MQMRALETARLRLEPQLSSHAEEMFAVLCDPAIYEFENAPPASLEELRARYRRLESRRSLDGRQRWLNWIVRESGSRCAIGYVQATVLPGDEALIGYEFASAWWGRGLAREAVTAAIAELAEFHGVRVVGAVFKQSNHRSQHLLQRLGMRSARADEFPGTLAAADEAAMVMRAMDSGAIASPPPTFG